MAVQKILPTDRIESGFRAKYNETVNEIWVNITDNGDGSFKITKSDGTTFNRILTNSFYTKEQVQNLLSGNLPATEESAGIVEIANQIEVDGGLDDSRVITSLKAKLSTLFPFKGSWQSDYNQDLDEPELSGYSVGMVVVHDSLIYQSSKEFNRSEPGANDFWQNIGGGSVPEPITKTGSDVVNGDIDLSNDSMNLNFTVYVNGISNAYQVQYNKNSKIMSGFFGIGQADTIEIIF